ncbi:hypothetical protein [Polyangium sp. 6x1]|uniref:hypothetical protein n=1 Tax=Polyangium sp. 6x1 TaxID=3042689 RepID=UPI0024829678|nr:hypothetical protein [Polyangium sp. 6x1]MDI1444350.1 hypothetical protein [Polyangium sp. 6x1]
MTGPIVHWSHGHAGKGFASLGMNIGGPLLSGLLGLGVGSAVQRGSHDGSDFAWGAVGGLIIGAASGAVAATIVDTTVLSTEDVNAGSAEAKVERGVVPASLALLPVVDVDRYGLSLVGRF